jgi:hypothetical protein
MFPLFFYPRPRARGAPGFAFETWDPTQANTGLEWATHHLLFGLRFGFAVFVIPTGAYPANSKVKTIPDLPINLSRIVIVKSPKRKAVIQQPPSVGNIRRLHRNR